MVMVNGMGNFFLRNEETGEYVEVGQISDVKIEYDENCDSDDVVKEFFTDKEFECECSIDDGNIEKLKKEMKRLERSSCEPVKPNPIFVPKHIARRRKW